jgi:NAD-dependent dihydropyrimidine dehydrogenase PreA subunit
MLKTLILYFTGTGNSLMVAKAIAKDLGNTKVAHISTLYDPQQVLSAERFGLVIPVYWGGLPKIVLNAIPLLKNRDLHYIFAVATHAGGPGKVLPQLRAELQKYGQDLNAGICLQMPSNYVLGYNPPSDASIQSDLAHADIALAEFVKVIKAAETHRPKSDFPRFSAPSKVYQEFIASVNQSDRDFWVDENCTECELCMRVCPVQNIEMDGGRPKWLHRCEQCLACINWCPAIAIKRGKRQSERKRYTNPRVSAEELELHRA